MGNNVLPIEKLDLKMISYINKNKINQHFYDKNKEIWYYGELDLEIVKKFKNAK
jgi:hypothetical protein